jgi:hypothetical protein
MFGRIKAIFSRTLEEESLSDRNKRMIPGALYAALAAAVYVLTFSTINIILFPGLHIAINWGSFFGYLFGFGIGLALAGAIVGWFTEDYMGVVGGGVIMTLLLLVGNVVVSLVNGDPVSVTAQSFITALPLVGAAILLALGLRMLVNRHLNILKEPRESQRKLMAGLVSIVFLVGLIPGIFSLYDHSTQTTLATLNTGLQTNSNDPSLTAIFPFDKIPNWQSHFDKKYTLYPRNSVVSTGSLDVTIRYEDGYTITCLVDTSSGNLGFFKDCSEGTQFRTP